MSNNNSSSGNSNRNGYSFPDFSLRRLLLQTRASRARMCDVERGSSSSSAAVGLNSNGSSSGNGKNDKNTNGSVSNSGGDAATNKVSSWQIYVHFFCRFFECSFLVHFYVFLVSVFLAVSVFFLEFCLASHFVPFCTSYFCRVIISLLAFDQKYLLDKFCKLGNRRQKEGKQKDFVSLWRKISYERERRRKKQHTEKQLHRANEYVMKQQYITFTSHCYHTLRMMNHASRECAMTTCKNVCLCACALVCFSFHIFLFGSNLFFLGKTQV